MTPIPFHDRDGFIWMDGKMLPWRQAQIHVLTHSLHYGTSVFEGERAYNGHIFKSRQHSQRLLDSAHLIHLPMTITLEEIESIKSEIMKVNKLTSCYIRAFSWRGSEGMGVDPVSTLTHVAIAAWEWGSYYGDEGLAKGLKLMGTHWRKPAPNMAPVASKTASLYNLCAMVKVECKKQGFDDAMMLDFEGFIAESTAANIFFIQDGVLVTPIADRFLNGITRQTVLELAPSLGLKTQERRIKPDEIKNFQECFLTGTAAELTPVAQIDDWHAPIGPVTKRMMQAYSAFVRGA